MGVARGRPLLPDAFGRAGEYRTSLARSPRRTNTRSAGPGAGALAADAFRCRFQDAALFLSLSPAHSIRGCGRSGKAYLLFPAASDGLSWRSGCGMSRFTWPGLTIPGSGPSPRDEGASPGGCPMPATGWRGGGIRTSRSISTRTSGPPPSGSANSVDSSRALVADLTPIELLDAHAGSLVLSELINRPGTPWDGATGSGMNWRLAVSELEAERRYLRLDGEPVILYSLLSPPGWRAGEPSERSLLPGRPHDHCD